MKAQRYDPTEAKVEPSRAEILDCYELPTGLNVYVGVIAPIDEAGPMYFAALTHKALGGLVGPVLVPKVMRRPPDVRLTLSLPRLRKDFTVALGLPWRFRSSRMGDTRRFWSFGLLGIGIDRHPTV